MDLVVICRRCREVRVVERYQSCPRAVFSHITSLATITAHRKDAEKVSKLEAQIPYHEGRGNKEEVAKIKEQIDAIWEKTREAALAM